MFQRTLRRLKPPPSLNEFHTKLGSLTPTRHNPSQPIIPPEIPTAITSVTLDEFRPGPKAHKFAAETKIRFPSAMRLVPRQNSKQFPFRVLSCPDHVFSVYHLKFLLAHEHPFTEKTMQFYRQKKETASLWCQVHASSAADGSNTVVRTSSERMVRTALYRALNAAGYDSAGKPLDGAGKPVEGSIRIFIKEPKNALKVDFGQTVAYLSRLVSDIIVQLQGDAQQKPPRSHHSPHFKGQSPRRGSSQPKGSWQSKGSSQLRPPSQPSGPSWASWSNEQPAREAVTAF